MTKTVDKRKNFQLPLQLFAALRRDKAFSVLQSHKCLTLERVAQGVTSDHCYCNKISLSYS